LLSLSPRFPTGENTGDLLNSGQSFAIGGLLDKRLSENLQKIPLLASIPLLGKLFQSRTQTKENNELFRPALRDRVPVEVEVLLIIPPRA